MKEKKIISEQWGKVKPFLIESYLAKGGYSQFLETVQNGKDPQEIVEAVKESGLRGRGGAGFLTGEKWMAAIETAKRLKETPYFVVNADESQPGTFKDRLMMEKNPHLVLEGALLGAYAVGAKQIFIYVNGKYENALMTMQKALEELEKKILEKEKIAGAHGLFEIKIVRGSGGYIFGEETALVSSLSGNRGEPRVRPPYPCYKGLFGRPTVVNNLETISNVVPVLTMGAGEYKKIGHKQSPGTKLFTVTGAVRNPGVIELPLGVTVRQVIKASGGLEKGKRLWFVQVGGIGRFLVPKELDYKLVYGEGKRYAPVGLGNILVVDKGADLHDLMLSWARFYYRESCGQCTPCREGTRQLLKIAERLRANTLLERDLENLRGVTEVMEKTSLCPLGRFATANWKEYLRLFRKNFFKFKNH